MIRRAGCVLLMLSLAAAVRGDGSWALERSTLAYHVSHPLHETDGVSRAARGKAVCRAGACDVLVAAPVNSFDSGDSNRDLHMLQVVGGAKFPLVSVRLRIPESAREASMARCDLEVEFAGHTAAYRQVAFTLVREGTRVRISGTIPAKLSDFAIPRPSLLAVPVKDDMPVRVETEWRPDQAGR